ncbi:MAG TPA: aldo/keto reductase [Candidatus Aminicenantes bacterium]|nr:aldo/keto reductase [Candidatus Aminicenantes bacterium]HRY65109.1 aldo/keto reductase [Candidatus Aminicenantes bacterium]HRZ72022.1 aldo/keto reductase [Candidatus Aminicenantes bacterium]
MTADRTTGSGKGRGPAAPNPELYGLPFTVDDFAGMPYRRLGPSGLRVSTIGLGTWKFGYPETGDGSRTGEAASLKILDRAFEEGLTFWDTANRYNDSSGNSERVIGAWFAAHPGQRRSVELATKVFGTMDGRTPNFCRLSRTNILEGVYACLDRLRTDHIDLLQFHQFDPSTPVEESLAAVEDLIARDLVRYFGVSNFTVEQIEACAAGAGSFPRARLLSVQNRFDILGGEEPGKAGVLELCARRGLAFIPWSPLRGGLISGRYLDREKARPGDRLVDEKRLDGELTPVALKKLRGLAEVAREGGWSVSQLAIAYMLRMPGLGPVIAACSTPEQVSENARAGRIALSDEQAERLAGILG